MLVRACTVRILGLIRKYQEKASGSYTNAKNTPTGTKIKIGMVWEDSETFDKSYIMVKGVRHDTMEEVQVRLGAQNLTRIVQVLGDDELAWIGQNLVMLGTQHYPGLNQTGLLWSGEKVAAPTNPTMAAPAAGQTAITGGPVSVDKMVNWLKMNQGLIGRALTWAELSKIPPEIITALMDRGWGEIVNNLPTIKEDARELIK